MKSIITNLILAVILSGCSAVPTGENIHTEITQTPVVQTLEDSILQSTNQASTKVTAESRSIITPSTTIQTSTQVSTPTLIETQTPTLTLTPHVTSTPITNNLIIADHTVIDKVPSIPPSALASAAAIKTLFMHQSTGNNIRSLGLECLSGKNWDPNYYPQECTSYAQISNNPYNNNNWDWPEWSTPMSDAIAKTDQWVSVVNSQQQNYQVLGMKFCYVDGWNQDFDYYRQKMEALERTYPHKKFIWATSALWSESAVGNNLLSAENIQLFNQQLRAYAIANNKPLYDLADIESHDPNGNLCQSHGFEALCDEYGGDGGGHPNVDGSIRLAKGFWWLMARIGGWNGN